MGIRTPKLLTRSYSLCKNGRFSTAFHELVELIWSLKIKNDVCKLHVFSGILICIFLVEFRQTFETYKKNLQIYKNDFA